MTVVTQVGNGLCSRVVAGERDTVEIRKGAVRSVERLSD